MEKGAAAHRQFRPFRHAFVCGALGSDKLSHSNPPVAGPGPFHGSMPQLDMKILFIGDIVGKPGRRIVHNELETIVSDRQVDLVVCQLRNHLRGPFIASFTEDDTASIPLLVSRAFMS